MSTTEKGNYTTIAEKRRKKWTAEREKKFFLFLFLWPLRRKTIMEMHSLKNKFTANCSCIKPVSRVPEERNVAAYLLFKYFWNTLIILYVCEMFISRANKKKVVKSLIANSSFLFRMERLALNIISSFTFCFKNFFSVFFSFFLYFWSEKKNFFSFH